MVERSDNKDVDGDVEEVPIGKDSVDLCDDSNDDDICEVEHLRKLFIGGLSGDTTEETLRKFYRKWGTVVDTVVMRDPATRRSRGFGFVTYTKVAMVDKAQANRPHTIDGKTVESKRALPRPENKPVEVKNNHSVKKLFVGGIKDSHDEECLSKHFSAFGNVVSIKFLTDNITGKRRGFALVEYDDYDAVDKAILQKTHFVNKDLLEVRKSVYNPDDNKRNSEKKKERCMAKNSALYQSNKNLPSCPSMANKRMQPSGPPVPAQQLPYQTQPQPPNNFAHQQYTPIPFNRHTPNSNNNQWGQTPQPRPHFLQPPYPHQQQAPAALSQQPPQTGPSQHYSGYSQASMPPVQAPPSGNWNNHCPGGVANSWNGQPPPPQPPVVPHPQVSNWHGNQWRPPPPPSLPPRPVAPANVPPPTNWQQSSAPRGIGPQPQYMAPGMYQQQQIAAPPPPPIPNNFGSGYQQNYGGGPTKHNNMHPNRMNPYHPPNNHYNSNPAAQGHGVAISNGVRYRR